MIRLMRWIFSLFVLFSIGCGDASPANENNETKVAYLCSESGELIFAANQAVPAPHPQTGRATLMRAGYCPQCERWRALPPPDVHNGNPLGYPCPDHNIVLQSDGPLPK